ncbi:hypothetical protein ANTPLA_LOCUS3751 [Anthophora plagiata]
MTVRGLLTRKFKKVKTPRKHWEHSSWDKKENGACMLRRATFSDQSKISWEVLMVAEGRGRSFPSEIRGLKGWPRLIPYTKNRKIWGKGPIEMERERDCLA